MPAKDGSSHFGKKFNKQLRRGVDRVTFCNVRLHSCASLNDRTQISASPVVIVVIIQVNVMFI